MKFRLPTPSWKLQDKGFIFPDDYISKNGSKFLEKDSKRLPKIFSFQRSRERVYNLVY